MLTAVLTVLPASAEEVVEASQESVTSAAEEELFSVDDDRELAAVGSTEHAEEPTNPPAAEEATAPAQVNYPIIAGFADQNGGVEIRWEPYGENCLYRVYRRTDTGWLRLAQTAETSCVVAQDAFTASVYTVRCVDADGRFLSDFYAAGWEYYYIGTPEIAYFANTVGGVRIYWKNLYEGQMRVYRRTVGSGWTRLTDGVAFDESLAYTDPGDGSQYMYFTDTTAADGVKYIYTIRAYDNALDAFVTDHNSGKSYTRQGLPVITGAANTETGVKISWKAYSGAAKYRVYCHAERPGMRSWDLLGVNWQRLTTTSGTSYVDTGCPDGEIRVYTVRALNSSDDFISDYDRVGVNNLYYSAPVIKNLEPVSVIGEGGGTVTSILLEWDALPGVEYRVYRKTAGESWTRLAQVEADSFTDNTAAPGTEYLYTLRVTDHDGNFLSDYLSGRRIKYTAVPAVKKIENVENGAEITWDPVEGADYYRVYYRAEEGGWIRLTTQKNTSFVDTSVKNGEERVYTLRALNAKKDTFVSDYNRDGWRNTYFAPPVIRSIESTFDGILLTWDRPEGAEDYRVYRKVGNASWTRLAQTAESSYLDNNIESGTTYRYTLRMVSAEGERFMSDYNSGKTIQYVEAPVITSLQNAEKGVKIKWDPVAGAYSYRIYYRVEDGWKRLAAQKKTEYTDTSVGNGETRIYTVRCIDEKGDFVSDFHAEGWSNTYYAPPEISSVTSADGGLLIAWEPTEGVAAYRVYRKPLNGSWGRITEQTTESSYLDTTAEKDVIYAYTLRCLDADGNLISDYLDDVRYLKNGTAVDGNIYENGTYGFKDGYLLKGLNRVGGKLRYYNTQGRMYRSTVVGNEAVGYYYTDGDGICCETKEMRLAAEFIAKYCKGDTLKEKAKYGFLYMARNYPYVTVFNDMPDDEKDVAPFAIELFELHKGTCYRYAAAYACVLKIAGYRSRFCYGIQGKMLHGWTEVYVDGRWLYCDVDAQLPGYGYEDYAPYMMTTHMWPLDKYWYSELTVKDGKATWGKKTSF